MVFASKLSMVTYGEQSISLVLMELGRQFVTGLMQIFKEKRRKIHLLSSMLKKHLKILGKLSECSIIVTQVLADEMS